MCVVDVWFGSAAEECRRQSIGPGEGQVAANIVNGIRNKANYFVITPGIYQVIQATAGFLAPSAFSVLFEMLIVAPLQALFKHIFRIDVCLVP